MSHGFAHVGLATHNMAATIAFYEGMLDFPRVADIKNNVADGGIVRLVYFECGEEQFLVFMECKNVAGIAEDFDTSLNGPIGVPSGLYHLALKVPSVAALEEKRRHLAASGLDVSEPVDHGYARSIFLRDPNDLQIEFCAMTRAFAAEDRYQEQVVRIAEAR